jgi:GLPGLI family protein
VKRFKKIIMRRIKNIFIVVGLLFASAIYAQNQSGIITYKGEVNQKFVDSFLTAYEQEKRPMAVKQRVVNAMRNAKPEEFMLHFKNDESYYYNKPDLEQEGSNMGSRAGLTPYYTNSATDTIIEMTRSLGKIALKPLSWEITGKTKKIGNYTCRQAKTTEKHYSRQGNYYYKEVVAWFTPEIPISFGPKYYKGLPGLILQIEDKEYTLTAIKINLNPSEDVEIKRLKKNDKVITQEESNNRMKEMESDRKKSMSNNR